MNQTTTLLPVSTPATSSPATSSPVASTTHGLNLQLVLTDSGKMPELMTAIATKRDSTFAALQALHFVHFARFLPSHDNSALQVITSFDGPLDAYALDFVIAIGDIFDVILSYVQDAPPLPVREHPQAFLAFVKLNNRVIVAPPALMWDDYPVFSAYPDKTVIDIVGPRTSPPPVREVEPSAVDLSDVQGHILAGYRAHTARHYSLRLHDAPAARALLARLLSSDHELPTITTALPWKNSPSYMLNIGVTCRRRRHRPSCFTSRCTSATTSSSTDGAYGAGWPTMTFAPPPS